MVIAANVLGASAGKVFGKVYLIAILVSLGCTRHLAQGQYFSFKEVINTFFSGMFSISLSFASLLGLPLLSNTTLPCSSFSGWCTVI